MKSFLRFLLLLFILITGFAAMAIYWTFYKPLPRYETTLTLPELRGEVTIEWDDYGVPHIFATTEQDLYTALGYVHAQDRLWQMTLAQLFMEGRFAEFLGEEVIELDKYSRTIGFWRLAAALQDSLDVREVRILNAYSNGVNRFIADNSSRLPVEFALTGITPMEWTPRHTIALSRLLAWELNVSWWSKITLGYLEDILPAAALLELFPQWDASAPRNLDPVQTRDLFSAVLPVLDTELRYRQLTGREGSRVGSNAWVSDGSRTESGYPLLAGDPHLGLDMPGKWYEVHLNLNGFNVSGATIAGAPLIVLGQNDHHAWTFTSLMGDDTDFFREIVNPLDRGQYLADSTDGQAVYAPFRIHREIIRTKEGNEVLHEVRLTQNGPIINDIYNKPSLLGDQLISMRWAGFEHSKEIRGLTEMAWARDFQEFQQGLDHMGTPGLNIVYADITGNIALFTVANLPVRRTPTLLFRNGWEWADRWNSFIPRNQLPRVINPPGGYIANANNPVVSENYPYYLTAFWEPDSRIRRITEVLDSHRVHDATLFRSLQNDVLSPQARDLIPIILPALEGSSNEAIISALPYLRNWNFEFSTNATAASLYELFFLNFTEQVFRAYIGSDAWENFVRLENFPIRVTTHMLKNPSVWLRTQDGDYSYRDSLIVRSMEISVSYLQSRLGAEPSEWRWENLHTLTLSPPLFREAAADSTAPAALRMIVKNVLSQGPFPVSGHSMTVNNTQYNWSDPFAQVLGASIRRIVDLSDLSRSESVIPTGQSGNPLSAHFADQTDLWLTGKYRIFEHNNVLTAKVRTRKMILKP